MDDDDCCIIDHMPPRPDITILEDDSNDLVITREVGQVACRDYPHARHQCATYPFDRTPHDFYCPKCHCFVCDQPAPCPSWGDGSSVADHCHATTGNRRGIWISAAGPSTHPGSSGRNDSPYLLQDAKSANPHSIVPVDSIEPHHSGHRYPLRPSILCRPYLRKSSQTKYACVPRKEAFSSDILWGDYPSVFRGGGATLGVKGATKAGNRRARGEQTQHSTALSVQVKKERARPGRPTNVVKPTNVAKQEICPGPRPRLLTNSAGKEHGTVKSRAKLLKHVPKVEPVVVDEPEEYEVERILDHRDVLSVRKCLQREYLVLWKGWSFQDSTWEPVSNLTNAAAILEEYLRSKDLKIKHK